MRARRSALVVSSLSLIAGLVGLAVAGAACASSDRAHAPSAVNLPNVPVSCAPLSIEVATPRMPTLGAMQLHARGGSRVASFALEGEGDARDGAEIEPGGGLRAGPHAGALTIVAKDGLCHSEAPVNSLRSFFVGEGVNFDDAGHHEGAIKT